MNDDTVLTRISDDVAREAARSRVAVVFDLDSTLFDPAPRTQFILRALGADAEFAANFADVAGHLARVEVRPSDYGVREILARFVHGPASAALVDAVRGYWREHFFASAHLHRDTLYPSAAEYVRSLRDHGADIYYLTGRGEARMREGTVHALRTHDFPLIDANLLMKPSEVLSDEGFKADVLAKLTHDHVWFFENEPVIIAQVRKFVPRVRIVFVRSAHSGKAPAPEDLPSITPDFRSGVRRVSE